MREGRGTLSQLYLSLLGACVSGDHASVSPMINFNLPSTSSVSLLHGSQSNFLKALTPVDCFPLMIEKKVGGLGVGIMFQSCV